MCNKDVSMLLSTDKILGDITQQLWDLISGDITLVSGEMTLSDLTVNPCSI